MNRAKSILFFIIIAFAWKRAYAENPVAVKQFINHKDWNFVENKGQLPGADIKYYGHQGGVYLYCMPCKISFVFTRVETDQNISEATGYAVRVQNPEPLHSISLMHKGFVLIIPVTYILLE